MSLLAGLYRKIQDNEIFGYSRILMIQFKGQDLSFGNNKAQINDSLEHELFKSQDQ